MKKGLVFAVVLAIVVVAVVAGVHLPSLSYEAGPKPGGMPQF
jgi:hypothetical protein